MMDKRIMVGQKLVTGLPGTEITDEFRQLVEEHKVGNVILFTRNVANPAQLKKLCADLQELIQAETGFPAFITVDQEGGNISRLCKPGTAIPGAMALCATDDPQNAYDAGFITGQELLACGVNFDLSPVMDVNNNPKNPVIGARSYGDDPEKVARFGCQMLRGLQDAHVAACLKHFPGHGDTAVDSHLGLPVIDKSMDELKQCELIPFCAGIKAGVIGVMTTHILFPQIEKNGVPATMSRTIMHDILRGELGFDGLILSDCMMMQAIATHYGTLQGASAAAKASVDLIFICHDNALTAQACELIAKELPDDELQASFDRIIKAKNALSKEIPDFSCVGSKEHLQKTREMFERSITLMGGPTEKLPELGCHPLFIGCAPAQASQAENPEEDRKSLPNMLKAELGGDALNFSYTPDEKDIQAAVNALPGHTAVVLSTFNAHLKPEQQNLMRALLDASEVPVIFTAMRNPYDLAGMTEKAWCLAAYDYTPDSLLAVRDVISGKIPPLGKAPIHL